MKFSLTFFLSSLLLFIVSCTSIPNQNKSNLNINLVIQTSDKNKELLIESLFENNIEFTVSFDEQGSYKLPDDLINSEMKYFCNSLLQDERNLIESSVFKSNQTENVLVVYSPQYVNYVKNLKEEYPNELFLSVDNSNYEEKTKEILNVISSLNRFSIVNKIDKSIKIEHEPRVRKDISKIYFVTNYELGKTLVPTFRSLSLNIDLYSTSEIFYDASDLKKLADFEDSFIPVSNKYINKISAKDASNIKIKIEKILIEDFLTIENVFQNNLFAKNYELNTGNAKIKRSNCVKRDLYLWKVSTNNIISQT
tara:strand:- start:4 stop:930 length:927 start_codon:yes stop_codon:yes gene_type:complete